MLYTPSIACAETTACLFVNFFTSTNCHVDQVAAAGGGWDLAQDGTCSCKEPLPAACFFFQARLASVVALLNVLLSLFHQLHPDADPLQMSIAEFSL